MLSLWHYPSTQGVRTGGQDRAPGILEELITSLCRRLAIPVRRGGICPPPDPPAATPLARIAAFRRDPLAVRPGEIPIGLGGDHSITYAHVTACCPPGGTGILWVDAHGDFNDEISSPSGNAHGMVLAAIAGAAPGFRALIDPRRSLVWGARSLDPGELDRLLRHGAAVLTSARLDPATLRQVDAILPETVYLSLDVDSLDPTYAPATGTPVAGGFAPEGLGQALAWLLCRRRVAGMDIVELDPLRPGLAVTLSSLAAVLSAVLPALRPLRETAEQKDRRSLTGT